MNVELFEKKVEESGIKRTFLAEKCGMTYANFISKVNGTNSPFNAKHIAIIKYWLRLTNDEVAEIFFDVWVE